MDYLGYALTIGPAAAVAWLAVSLVIDRKGIFNLLKKHADRYSLAASALILLLFLAVSILYVKPVEQLYFDENIYQGIALNILHHGMSEWCQYGTGYLGTCYANSVYHDPAGYSLFIALAFGIFGVGNATSYNLELLFGCLSIAFIYLLSSLLLKDRKAVIASTLVFATMPELFIWSRALAVPDLPFMTFTIFSFLAFLVMKKRPNANTLSIFLASLVIASYTRTEGILLIPLFAALYLLYDEGEGNFLKAVSNKVGNVIKTATDSTDALLFLLLFVMLLVPQAYYISYELSNPNYGQQASGQALFSISNFNQNVFGTSLQHTAYSCIFLGLGFGPNICYFLGYFNRISLYPTVFPQLITLLFAIGIIALLVRFFRTRKNEHASLLIMLLLWAVGYYVFYGLFYAGSATFGVDVRFMLQVIPPMSILAGIGIGALSDAPAHLAKTKRNRSGSPALAYGAFAVLVILVLILEFYQNFPIFTLAPKSMPQQSVILNAINFFYANYSDVPANCMVFTYTPDIWYMENRSAAQISYLTSPGTTFSNDTKNYRCFALDQGYWCNVPPETQTGGRCMNYVSGYNTSKLGYLQFNSSTGMQEYGFYRILNYTNSST